MTSTTSSRPSVSGLSSSAAATRPMSEQVDPVHPRLAPERAPEASSPLCRASPRRNSRSWCERRSAGPSSAPHLPRGSAPRTQRGRRRGLPARARNRRSLANPLALAAARHQSFWRRQQPRCLRPPSAAQTAPAEGTGKRERRQRWRQHWPPTLKFTPSASASASTSPSKIACLYFKCHQQEDFHR